MGSRIGESWDAAPPSEHRSGPFYRSAGSSTIGSATARGMAEGGMRKWEGGRGQALSADGLTAMSLQLDGKDLSRVLLDQNADSPHSHFYWQMGADKKKAQWVVRKGDWKLLGNCRDTSNQGELTQKDKKLFLANLKKDPSEGKNLSEMYPDLLKELLEIRERTLQSVYPSK